MDSGPVQLPSLIVCLLAASIIAAGCTAPAAPGETMGEIRVFSTPPGGEIYLDSVYRGTAPSAILQVLPGSHHIEIRSRGYDPWVAEIMVTSGNATTVTALLTSTPAPMPVTIIPTTVPVQKPGQPRVHIDGYWYYPPGRSGTGNPVPLVVHTEAFNTGTAGAREVTVSANFYYDGRMICFDTVYLGTLAEGSHVSREKLVSCTLPSSFSSQDLAVRFENPVVIP